MNLKNTKKYIWIFLLCCLLPSNILWYTAYSAGDESVSTSLVILTSFLPALTSLILCNAHHELLKRAAHVSYVQGRGFQSLFCFIAVYPQKVTCISVYVNAVMVDILFQICDCPPKKNSR